MSAGQARDSVRGRRAGVSRSILHNGVMDTEPAMVSTARTATSNAKNNRGFRKHCRRIRQVGIELKRVIVVFFQNPTHFDQEAHSRIYGSRNPIDPEASLRPKSTAIDEQIASESPSASPTPENTDVEDPEVEAKLQPKGDEALRDVLGTSHDHRASVHHYTGQKRSRYKIMVEVMGPEGPHNPQTLWALADTGSGPNLIFKKKLLEIHKDFYYYDEPRNMNGIHAGARCIGWTHLYFSFLRQGGKGGRIMYDYRFDVLEDQGPQQLPNWDVLIGREYLVSNNLVQFSPEMGESHYFEGEVSHAPRTVVTFA